MEVEVDINLYRQFPLEADAPREEEIRPMHTITDVCRHIADMYVWTSQYTDGRLSCCSASLPTANRTSVVWLPPWKRTSFRALHSFRQAAGNERHRPTNWSGGAHPVRAKSTADKLTYIYL